MASDFSNSLALPKIDHHTTRMVLRRLANTLIILFGIAFLTLLGLFLAQQGRKGLPANLLSGSLQALHELANYLLHHPGAYVWHKEIVPAGRLVGSVFLNSAGLLLLSLVIAALLGGSLGILTAQLRNRKSIAPLMVLLSLVGVSIPTFLFGMFLWALNVQVMRMLGMTRAPLPQVGFGWDKHLIMPALVLAARPFAQIMQVTYVNMSKALDEEYVRAAKGKGVPHQLIIYSHALRNILIPILTTLSSSLRFSLASLPIVESFFYWPGIGLSILQAIQLEMTPLIVDLVVSLGFMFLLINLGVEFLFPLIDPRLRENGENVHRRDELTWGESALSALSGISAWWAGLRAWFSDLFRKEPQASASLSSAGTLSLPVRLPFLGGASKKAAGKQQSQKHAPALVNIKFDEQVPFASNTRMILKDAFTNLPLIVGTLVVLALLALAVFGKQWATADPYLSHGVMIIDGEVWGPPFPPSTVFPWGTDAVGRDVRALVLAGARQTLALGLFGMIARVVVGVSLGMLAGWWQRSWLDRVINTVVSIWAAFPVTLFAMILILGLGIQRGMSVFIIALCTVGWGEIAQYVRGEVIGQKPQLYVEAARSVGARSSGILTRHILPHLLPDVLVLASMEMGAVLMLLADLGYLNIFMGGGSGADLLGESHYVFSDMPEWSAMLANVRVWWRSYPWMALYPGGMFFLSILAFNLWGEGLRRFLAESRISLNRFINRYTLIGGLVLLVGSAWAMRSVTPMELYKSQARQFDAARAMQDIQELSSPAYRGRESGTDSDRLTADYIAARMQEIGLFPGGTKDTYLQEQINPKFILTETPRLEIAGENGSPDVQLAYRQDFVERISNEQTYGEGEGRLVGLALGQGDRVEPVPLSDQYFFDKILLVRDSDLANLSMRVRVAGLLVVTDEFEIMDLKILSPFYNEPNYPTMYVSTQAADRLLATAGSSLAALDTLSQQTPADQYAQTAEGASIHESILGLWGDHRQKNYNVIGYIPGTGSDTVGRQGRSMDNDVIMVSAYYDGSGMGPDGTLYPGANDNASGVAAMLEIARVMKEGNFQPKKTVIFVAWSGGDRFQGLNVDNAMNAKTGFLNLNVEAVIELSGVGAGAGKGIAIDQGTSFRMVTVFQQAAQKIGVSTTNRGRGPHFNIANWHARRTAMSAIIHWDGSDALAHTKEDTYQTIDPIKLRKAGQTTALAVTVLSRELNY